MRHSVTVEANAETLHELASHLTDRPGCVVPFIGAGTSMAYGMPGWTNFLRYLKDLVKREGAMTSRQAAGVDRMLKAGRLEEAAQRLYLALGEPKFRMALQGQFRLNGQHVSGQMRHIIDLAAGFIITTNYDRVVEGAWRASFARLGMARDVEQLLATSPADLDRALSGGGHALLKLHGDVERPETWVLTAERYAAMYGDPAFKRFLERFFASHVPLFIGCSMTEERILDAMRGSGCTGYAILGMPASDADRLRLISRLKDCVKVIWLRREDAVGGRSIHDVLEPVLHWLAVRRKVGRIEWEAETRTSSNWSSVMQEFERKGEFRAAIEWILQHWEQIPSWELAVEYLRFSDLAGNPSGWQTYATHLRPTLHGKPAPIAQHAIDYYYGRLLGQLGHWASAFRSHSSNRPSAPHTDHYQVRSWFEEGQLRFRTEDFEEAKAVFEEVYHLLLGQGGHVRALVDVLKFLGTMEVLDTIYDAPASERVWIKGQHSNPELALLFADRALRMATAANYEDGRAWALCVSAFGQEAKRDAVAARECYRLATDVVQAGACRSGTSLYILLYEAAFLRRDGDHLGAAQLLHKAAAAILGTERGPDLLHLAEQHLLLAWAVGDPEAAQRQLRVISDTHLRSPMLLDGSTQLERRIQRLQTDPRFAAAGPEVSA